MSRFDPTVLLSEDRAHILSWLDAALEAIDPVGLTRDAIAASGIDSASVIAIGKAAPAMVRGAGQATKLIGGVCISDHIEEVPASVQLLIGDHPIPLAGSAAAAKAALKAAETAPPEQPLIGLISGGGSSLCEAPKQGVSTDYVEMAYDALIRGGANIEEINLVRGHLSAIKCGGLARAAGRSIDTYVISDVAGADPGLTASGPTVPRDPEPQSARAVMERFGIEVTAGVWSAMRREYEPIPKPKITLLADGHDAGQAVARATPLDSVVRSEWLRGDLTTCLDKFLGRAATTVTIAVGEPVLEVTTSGRGGRATHAALLAAQLIAGSDDVFVAFATDGVDGLSGAAGAIVDGSTISRGGDPTLALGQFQSGEYLESTGDLLICEPTGTNVSDIWILWRRSPGHNVK